MTAAALPKENFRAWLNQSPLDPPSLYFPFRRSSRRPACPSDGPRAHRPAGLQGLDAATGKFPPEYTADILRRYEQQPMAQEQAIGAKVLRMILARHGGIIQ